MMKRIVIVGLIMVCGLIILQAEFSFDLETGIAFPGYNDVRIPGEGNSTKFSLTEELEADAVFSYRLILNYRLNEHSEFSVLFAPLTIEPTGKTDRTLIFQDEEFEAETQIDGIYRFDSYRLQYRYHFGSANWILRAAGITVKVRDAEIAISSADKSAKKLDTGVVPLINFLFAYDLSERISISLDGAALASPYGRAADVLTSINYTYGDRVNLKAGYRILEGGSDISEVYTFAMFHYAVIALQISL